MFPDGRFIAGLLWSHEKSRGHVVRGLDVARAKIQFKININQRRRISIRLAIARSESEAGSGMMADR